MGMMVQEKKQSKLKPNEAWAQLPLFARSKWDSLTFGDFADCISERAHPLEFANAIYMGLEHLDPENLHIRRWGKGSDVEGVKLRFYKGDIIFGRRRAYQRKLAVAEMDGICSAHAMVLRANPEMCLPEFLPFLMMSDAFMKRAVEISVGSLSPTISWGVLKQQRFALPPLDQQRRIAELLWAVDDDCQKKTELTTSIQFAIDSLLGSLFPVNGKFASDISVSALQDLCAEPISYGIVQAGPHVDDGIPYIRVTDMTSGPLRLDGMLRTDPEIAARFKRSTVRAGELVCALRGPAGLLSFVPDELDGANLTQGTARISLHDKGMTQYILDVFESPFMRTQLGKKAKGSTFTELTLGTLRAIEVPVLQEARRLQFAKQMTGLRTAKAEGLIAANASRSLLEQLLNTVHA